MAPSTHARTTNRQQNRRPPDRSSLIMRNEERPEPDVLRRSNNNAQRQQILYHIWSNWLLEIPKREKRGGRPGGISIAADRDCEQAIISSSSICIPKLVFFLLNNCGRPGVDLIALQIIRTTSESCIDQRPDSSNDDDYYYLLLRLLISCVSGSSFLILFF